MRISYIYIYGTFSFTMFDYWEVTGNHQLCSVVPQVVSYCWLISLMFDQANDWVNGKDLYVMQLKIQRMTWGTRLWGK